MNPSHRLLLSARIISRVPCVPASPLWFRFCNLFPPLLSSGSCTLLQVAPYLQRHCSLDSHATNCCPIEPSTAPCVHLQSPHVAPCIQAALYFVVVSLVPQPAALRASHPLVCSGDLILLASVSPLAGSGVFSLVRIAGVLVPGVAAATLGSRVSTLSHGCCSQVPLRLSLCPAFLRPRTVLS